VNACWKLGRGRKTEALVAVKEALFSVKAGNGRKGTYRWKALLVWKAAAVMRGLWQGLERGSANWRKLGRRAWQKKGALVFGLVGSFHR